MKVGDLVEFSGEYYFLLEDDRWEWIVSKLPKTGLITSNHSGWGFIITSGEIQYVIRHDTLKRNAVYVKVLNSLDDQL
tara:strand:- start:2216 stop:2449 length:234 start_codon:yes stop_codon:yes gene_type:complete